MARNGQDGWTEEQLTLLRREWRAGTPTADIAQTLGRTEKAVKRRADALKLRRATNDAYKTKEIDPSTPKILEAWKAGLSVRAIAEAHSKSENAVILLASYHRVRRPAGHKRASPTA